MKLSDLAKALTFYKATASIDNIDVKGLEMDSRKVEKGFLFICIDGFTVDGHAFAADAEMRGAVAIIATKPVDVSIPVLMVEDSSRALALLANSFYGQPTRELNLIGVTGTNGKTTVTYLLEEIFNKHKHKTGLIGTIQMKIGNESYEVTNTTPDALFLQKNFRKMVDEQVTTTFMEVSSHALDLGRVFGCEFDIAIFTNLTQDHLDYHPSMEAYLHAKSLLFSQLGNSYDKERPKFAVINKDDSYSTKLLKTIAQPVLTYGIDSDADITVENLSLDANGSSFTLKTLEGNIPITSKMMGKFSVYNMLAATGAALCAGIPLETIKAALEETTGVRGRFEPVMVGQSYGVIIDYAHTPDSLENALSTIQSFAKGKIYVVVGCGGDRDKKKRPLMAQVAVKYADQAIFTSDNPRTEDPQQIITDMIEGITYENYTVIMNRREAIQHSIDITEPEDIVLIAGKGHETYQIIGKDVFDFDDREVAEQAISKRGN